MSVKTDRYENARKARQEAQRSKKERKVEALTEAIDSYERAKEILYDARYELAQQYGGVGTASQYPGRKLGQEALNNLHEAISDMVVARYRKQRKLEETE